MQRRQQKKMYLIGGLIILAACIIATFALYGTAIVVQKIKRFGPESRERVMAGEHADMAMKCLIADSCLKMLIAGILSYALIRIAYVARNNH